MHFTIIQLPCAVLPPSIDYVIRIGNLAHGRLQDLRAKPRLTDQAHTVVASNHESFIGTLRDIGGPTQYLSTFSESS